MIVGIVLIGDTHARRLPHNGIMLLAQLGIALPTKLIIIVVVTGVRLIAFFISGGSRSDCDHASALTTHIVATIVFLQFEYRVAKLGSRERSAGTNERVTLVQHG